MFHDQTITIRLRNDWAEKCFQLAEDKPDQFDSTSHVIRVAIAEFLRKHGRLPKEASMKSYEGKVMKDD